MVARRRSRVAQPALLGVIGRDHVEQRFLYLGCLAESFAYTKALGETRGAPWVIEFSFGYGPAADATGTIVAGVNWSPVIGNPFRKLGEYGISLERLLEGQRVRMTEPVVVLVHLATARPAFTDRGKTALAVS